MAIQIVNPPGLGILSPGTFSAPFKVMMTVSPGAKSIVTATSREGVTAVSPLFLKTAASVDITQFITQMGWDAADDQLYTTLSLTLDNFRGVFNQIPHGTKIRVQVRKPFYDFKGTQHGKFYDYITAYIFEKSRTADGSQQTMTLTAYDKMYWLANNDFHKVFKAGEKRPGGWTASQIVRDIASKLKIPIGVITPTKKKFKRMELKGTALECIQKALAEDKKATKRKVAFQIDMRDGKLNVRLENPNPKTAYKFDEDNAIENGTLSERLGDKFATRVIVTGNSRTDTKTAGGNKAKKIKEVKIVMNPTDKSYQKAFGIMAKSVKLKGTHSPAELRQLARNQMNAALRPERDFNISVRGVPHLWPGTRVWVNSGYFGVNGLVKVKNVSYSVDNGEFKLDMGLGVDNKTILSAQQVRLYYRKRAIRY